MAGQLTFHINPLAVQVAQAQWSIDGGNTWNDNGDTVQLPAGQHTVTFKDVNGWDTPADIQVNVTDNNTTTETATYTQTQQQPQPQQGGGQQQGGQQVPPITLNPTFNLQPPQVNLHPTFNLQVPAGQIGGQGQGNNAQQIVRMCPSCGMVFNTTPPSFCHNCGASLTGQGQGNTNTGQGQGGGQQTGQQGGGQGQQLQPHQFTMSHTQTGGTSSWQGPAQINGIYATTRSEWRKNVWIVVILLVLVAVLAIWLTSLATGGDSDSQVKGQYSQPQQMQHAQPQNVQLQLPANGLNLNVNGLPALTQAIQNLQTGKQGYNTKKFMASCILQLTGAKGINNPTAHCKQVLTQAGYTP